jgi:hypothetical protein
MRGVNFATVQNAIRQGRIHLVGNGQLDPVEADREWAANTDLSKPKNTVSGSLVEVNGGLLAPSGAVTFNAVRTQHEQLRLELSRMDLALRSGELEPVATAKRVLFEEGRKVRDAVLRVAVQVQAAVAAETSPLECGRLINEALREALGAE